MLKVLDDTLKSPSGKYSRKSLTMLVSFIFGILLGFLIFLGECYSVKFDKTYYVFECFMIMAGYNSLLNVADKKLENKGNNFDDNSNEITIHEKKEITLKSNEQVS